MSGTVTETAAIQRVSALPEPVARRGLDEPQWRTLMNSLYPGAKAESVLMVVDYCRARKLDPMKKPCHIVPMKMKQGDEFVWRDVVLPGIYEYRTTAMRTGLYLGHTAAEYGPVVEEFGVKAPEWCSMTFKRLGPSGVAIEFPVTVYFREVCTTKEEWADKKRTGRILANDRWMKAPIQMLTKVCEAAGLREAFPDEFGGEATFDELDGRDVIEAAQPAPIRPAARLSERHAGGEPAQAGRAAPVGTVEGVPAGQAVMDAEVVNQPSTAEAPAPADPVPAVMRDSGHTVTVVPERQNIGAILNVDLHDGGAVTVTLSTGMRAATRDAEIIAAAKKLEGTGAQVELVTRASSDPRKYFPILEAIEEPVL